MIIKEKKGYLSWEQVYGSEMVIASDGDVQINLIRLDTDVGSIWSPC